MSGTRNRFPPTGTPGVTLPFWSRNRTEGAQARRYKSRRDLTRALRLVARADLELRSSPPDKRLVLERLVYELASEPKPAPPAWASAQLSFES